MICPKCGSEQPDSAECVRCGVLVNLYKGPMLGAAALRPPASPPAAVPPPRPAGESVEGTVYAGPPPLATALPQGTFLGTFGVGEILRETFSIYFSNLLPFILLTALALLPLYGLRYLLGTPAAGSLTAVAAKLLLFVVGLLSPNLATAAITFGVYQQLRGKNTSVGECLRRGVSLLLPVFGLALAQTLVVGLAAMACLVPGIVVAVRWAVSIPAAVTEGTGVSASMDRSSFLTDGLRWDVFGVLFVLGVINIGSALLIGLAAVRNPPLLLLLSGVKDLLVVGLSATGAAVLYYRLRSVKESIDVDQIASVFT
jgi:hypothetical protein